MSKRLNYSKWDALELSDDSDIETHPNVDKKSMIRWKQRDIHEKRAMRKQKLEHLARERQMNEALSKRIDDLVETVKAQGSRDGLNHVVADLKQKEPSYDQGLKQDEQPSEDWMILSLVLQVVKAVNDAPPNDDDRDARVLKELAFHKKRIEERQIDVEKERKELEDMGKGKITSEDVHIGWDSKTKLSKTPESALTMPSTKGKQKETVVETLNPDRPAHGAVQARNDDEDEEPELTDAARRFSRIKRGDFAAMFATISNNPSLLAESTTDALLVEAFNVILEQGPKGEQQARNCIEKGLALQYSRQLGRDGVNLFFKRIGGGDPRAQKVFMDDVQTTGDRIVKRALEIKAERGDEQQQREQIQLVAQNEGTQISFEVPSGPPPETIELTGEGSEELDPEQVRLFLLKRWQIFDQFPLDLQEALKSESLDQVNKVLGDMQVQDAERVVEQLQEANILSFSEPGVKDMTQ